MTSSLVRSLQFVLVLSHRPVFARDSCECGKKPSPHPHCERCLRSFTELSPSADPARDRTYLYIFKKIPTDRINPKVNPIGWEVNSTSRLSILGELLMTLCHVIFTGLTLVCGVIEFGSENKVPSCKLNIINKVSAFKV